MRRNKATKSPQIKRNEDWKRRGWKEKNPRNLNHRNAVAVDGHVFIYVKIRWSYWASHISLGSFKGAVVLTKGRSVGATTISTTSKMVSTVDSYEYQCKNCKTIAIRVSKKGKMEYDLNCSETELMNLLA